MTTAVMVTVADDSAVVRQCEYLARSYGTRFPAHNCHDFYILRLSDDLEIRYFTDNYTTIKYRGRTVFERKADGFRLVRQDDDLWVADLFGWEGSAMSDKTDRERQLEMENRALRIKLHLAEEAAKILRPGIQADCKSFGVGYEEYPYSDTYDPDNGDEGENPEVSVLIGFFNAFRGENDPLITHYAKDPEEQETLARQSANLGW